MNNNQKKLFLRKMKNEKSADLGIMMKRQQEEKQEMRKEYYGNGTRGEIEAIMPGKSRSCFALTKI